MNSKPKFPTALSCAKHIGNECLVVRSRYLSRTITAIYDQAFAELGASANQMNILVTVVLHSSMTASELGEQLNMEKSTLSRNLKRMQEKGWISLERHGRQQIITTTRSGSDLLVSAHAHWERAQQATTQLLGKENAQSLRGIADQLWHSAE